MDLSRLKDLRIKLGYNQKDFAAILGIKQTTYNTYETGRSDPGIDFLARIAAKYNVCLDYLAGLTNDPSPIGAKKLPTSEDGDERLNAIIDIYNGLNEDGKEHLYKTAQHCSYDAEYKKRDQSQKLA